MVVNDVKKDSPASSSKLFVTFSSFSSFYVYMELYAVGWSDFEFFGIT